MRKSILFLLFALFGLNAWSFPPITMVDKDGNALGSTDNPIIATIDANSNITANIVTANSTNGSKSIATSANQTWSTSNNVLSTTNDMGEESYIFGNPAFYRKKVMVVGSSVAAGSGATTPSTEGWANKLGTALVAKGYTFLNRSISGNTTALLIARFYKDVVPYHPDYCIIALSMANEGLVGGNDETIFTTFTNNIRQLINMCRQNGIVPIISNCYPNNNYTADDYRYIRQFNEWLNKENVLQIDLLGNVNNGSGAWIEGSYHDALHPNTAGHAEMFYGVTQDMFDVGERIINWSPNIEEGSLYTGNSVATSAIVYSPSDTISSFTFTGDFRMDSYAGGKAFLALSNGLRIRTPDDVFTFTNSTGVDTETPSTVKSSDKNWHNLAIVFKALEGKAYYYVDGALCGNVTEAAFNPTAFAVASRTSTGSANLKYTYVKNVGIWRIALNDYQISRVAKGVYPKASLELFSPMQDSGIANATRIVNLAPTKAYLKVNEANCTSSSVGLSRKDHISDLSQSNTIKSGNGYFTGLVVPNAYTVATLPTAASYTNATAIVTDGDSATDCTNGNSANVVQCFSNGAAWLHVN